MREMHRDICAVLEFSMQILSLEEIWDNVSATLHL